MKAMNKHYEEAVAAEEVGRAWGYLDVIAEMGKTTPALRALV